ncbi:MAG: glycosyltransferase family 4 protein [Anaerolineales bacterium]|nr:glycosyltransferase family 4 protein [Anaerolineales bacterium]
MHILLIHQAFAAINEPGGTRHHEIARYLVAQGHKVTIIASPVSYLTGAARLSRWKTIESGGEGITIIRAYTYRALHRSFVHRVFSFFSFMFSSFWIGLNVREVDLVWGTSPPIFQGVSAWLAARLKQVPFVFEIRDLWPAFAVAVGVLHNPFLINATEWLEKFLYKHADQLVINSPGFVDHIRDRCGKTPVLIPNGADKDMFDPEADGEQFRQEYGLKNKFVALYAGAHGMSNDLEVLLEAMNILRDHREITLILLGDGKEKAHLQQKAEDLDLENVLFLSPVPKSEMMVTLAGADVCVAILKPIEMYKTVYPNKVFDYMAAGKPVLLAIDGVIRSVVDEARAGIFVQPGNPQTIADGLLKMASDPAGTARMGKNGRLYLQEHFDRNELASKMNQLFEQVRNGRTS